MKKILTTLAHIILLSFFTQAQTQIGDDIDGEAVNDNSGHSVSMPDANTVAIGAPLNDGNGSNAGHVRIYSWNESAWVQKGSDIDGEAAEDWSGWAVSMPDANTIAIGAVYNDFNGINGIGHVRIYSWNGGSWMQKGDDIDGEAAQDNSGFSVSMPDANTVAIGAPYNDDNGNAAGHVRVYSWNGIEWTQKGADIDGEGTADYCGTAVSMPDANTVAVASPNYEGEESVSGQVRVFSWDGTEWVQMGEDIYGNYGAFGHSLSMPEVNTLAIGAPSYSGVSYNAGLVRVYGWNGSSWAQKGADIDGEAAQDNFGYSVSMPDANKLAVGAHRNDGNGSNSGHVRVFAWNGSEWVQEGDDIDGEAASDNSGYSVSMPDAHTLAIGARWNDGNGNNAGHVRIFSVGISELPETLNLNDISIPPDPDNCFAASSQITVSDFMVANGGSVTLVTGHSGKILLQEGMQVQHGGYLHAWIDVAGKYCDQPESMLATGSQDESLHHIQAPGDNSPTGLKVYPNPTAGRFTLELNGEPLSVIVRIFGTHGEIIMVKEFYESSTINLDLSGRQAGVYFLQIMTAAGSEYFKLIKCG